MNHNYKLTDFRRMQGEADTDIHERMASVDLRNVRELPKIIVDRLETMINKTIADYEQENNVVIPLNDMEISMQIEVDTLERELFLQAYIGYRIDEDCLHGKEIISSDDEDYDVIKKYFLAELNNFVFGQIDRIAKSA